MRSEVNATWEACKRTLELANGGRPTTENGRMAITLRASRALSPEVQAHSGPGVIEARLGAPLDEKMRMGLRHEAVHQFLFAACRGAEKDALFHEGLALSLSGELPLWTDSSTGPYLSELKSVAILQKDPRVKSVQGRRALARLLVGGEKVEGVHRALMRQLSVCATGAAIVPLKAEELVAREGVPSEEAWVLLSRHSGEVVESSGPIDVAVQPGSTLKPFLVARAPTRPAQTHVPVRKTAEWECGLNAGAPMTWQQALARSCNGYFLDVMAGGSGRVFGAWEEVLDAVGMQGRPSTVADAIGLTRVVKMSPRAVAQAFRALALVEKDVLHVMREVPVEGTLSQLPDSEWARAEGLAMKTGTVRDLASRPVIGWIVVVSEDLVGVMMSPGRAPREILDELRKKWPDARKRSAWEAARVQTFALLPPGNIEMRCAKGRALWLRSPSSFRVLGDGAQNWSVLGEAQDARVLCLSAPVMVSFPGLDGARPYAGVFSSSPAPGRLPANATRAERSRRGSDIVFTTTRARYAVGVLQSEDAQVKGPVRHALMHVVDFNMRHSRHGARPVCDTTHCQVFQGTPAASSAVLDEAARVLAMRLDAREDWLPFAKGGDAPWEAVKSRREMEERLKRPVQRIERVGSQIHVLQSVGSTGNPGEEAFLEEPARYACEVFRNTVQLPSCPDAITREGDAFVFRGRGEGHGLGMDVEKLKRNPALTTEKAVLEAAYGDSVSLGP